MILDHSRYKDGTRSSGPSRCYCAWNNMKDRCSNPNNAYYHRYGARGINVCEKWVNSFDQFFSDMGHPPDNLSLHRLDNDGNYNSTNCVWTDQLTQSRCTSLNHSITHEGRTQCITDWAKETGIPHHTILKRMRKGLTLAEVISAGSSRVLPKSYKRRPLKADGMSFIQYRRGRFEVRITPYKNAPRICEYFATLEEAKARRDEFLTLYP